MFRKRHFYISAELVINMYLYFSSSIHTRVGTPMCPFYKYKYKYNYMCVVQVVVQVLMLIGGKSHVHAGRRSFDTDKIVRYTISKVLYKYRASTNSRLLDRAQQHTRQSHPKRASVFIRRLSPSLLMARFLEVHWLARADKLSHSVVPLQLRSSTPL